MDQQSLILVDIDRAEQFAILGATPRLMSDYTVREDEGGFAWCERQISRHCFAAASAGTNLIFDPEAHRRQHPDWVSALQQAQRPAPPEQLAALAASIRLGPRAERLLWAIHRRVLRDRRSVVVPADADLAEAVWGSAADRWPRHWRREIACLLRVLSRLHLGALDGDAPPNWGTATALLTHAALLWRRGVVCGDDCPWQPVAGHRHFLVNIGGGFLGGLEELGEADATPGVRRYDFRVGSSRFEGPSLWRLGKSGRLMTAYWPAKLGAPDCCSRLDGQQHRLLQAIVRETTRRRRSRRASATEPELVQQRQVPDLARREVIACELLGRETEYVAFCGNGRRRGCGYLFFGEHGWLCKAGYAQTQSAEFVDDLTVLAGLLGLVVVALERDNSGRLRWLDLEQVAARARYGSPHTLQNLHVRIYTACDYLRRWESVFRPPPPTRPHVKLVTGHTIGIALARRGLKRKDLAGGIEEGYSRVCKILSGRRHCDERFVRKAMAWIERQPAAEAAPPEESGSADAGEGEAALDALLEPPAESDGSGGGTMLDAALAYLRRGWSIVPQVPSSKKPAVRWKPFQQRRPTVQEIRQWYRRWPQAGIAVVLGPVSGLLVVDVDGEEAHRVLLERLGAEPLAPQAHSGSGDPHRYHLYFECPEIPTKAKQTPWHPKLEFRGQGGIVIAPPSLHRSGRRYRWARGRSLDDVALPVLPRPILDALQPRRREPRPVEISDAPSFEVGASTRAFLSGRWSEGPRWNERLFRAACDLFARGIPRDLAEPALIAGARPWTAAEEDAAIRTIASAYSQVRVPSVR